MGPPSRCRSNVPDLWTTPRPAQFLIRIADSLAACDMACALLRARLVGWSPLLAGQPARSRMFHQEDGSRQDSARGPRTDDLAEAVSLETICKYLLVTARPATPHP